MATNLVRARGGRPIDTRIDHTYIHKHMSTRSHPIVHASAYIQPPPFPTPPLSPTHTLQHTHTHTHSLTQTHTCTRTRQCQKTLTQRCSQLLCLQLAKTHHSMTPLMHACHEGQRQIVTMMLDMGADINARNDKGSALLVALGK